MSKRCIIFFAFLILAFQGFSQRKEKKAEVDPLSPSTVRQPDSIRVVWIDSIPMDSDFAQFVRHSACKTFAVTIPKGSVVNASIINSSASIPNTLSHQQQPLLRVSGNVLYDVTYRSHVDTPFAEKDVYQHTLQTRLDFVYKDQYPFKLYITTRFSNSSLFRKYTDFNLHYTKQDFERLLKQKMIERLEAYMASKLDRMDSLQLAIDAKKRAIRGIDLELQKPGLAQQLVQGREKMLNLSLQKFKIPDSILSIPAFKWSSEFRGINGDDGDSKNNEKFHDTTLRSDINLSKIQSLRERMDSLRRALQQAELLLSGLQSQRESAHYNWRKEILQAPSADSLQIKMKEFDVPDSVMPKGFRQLYAINSFSLGRSVANYSELSVKNISITGLQVEYNPGFYYAFAAGKVDYRFRDYIVPGYSRSGQYVVLGRFGKGMKNGNHVFFTYYTGKRQFFNSSISSQPNASIPEYNLAGFTIEGVYKINRNTSLTAEVAKSTKPYYTLDSIQKRGWINSVTGFGDRSNEAYSLLANSYLPRTLTRLSGKIQYLGPHFQSFSTFTSGASRLQWLAKVEQPFWKKRLNVISSVQQNEYNNPFITTTYSSSAVLTSIQATVRIKKWPVVSLGYFPSYQLTKIGDESFSETRYYSLVANSSYAYNYRSVQMTSYFVFSQFYNHSADSGFIYFNSKNYLAGQNATIGKLTMTLNASLSTNTDYDLYTIEHSDQFLLSEKFSFGAGVKMIRQLPDALLLWGYSGNLRFYINKIGEIQLMMDKGFIPTLNRKMTDNTMGRLTYLKTF